MSSSNDSGLIVLFCWNWNVFSDVSISIKPRFTDRTHGTVPRFIYNFLLWPPELEEESDSSSLLFYLYVPIPNPPILKCKCIKRRGSREDFVYIKLFNLIILDLT